MKFVRFTSCVTGCRYAINPAFVESVYAYEHGTVIQIHGSRDNIVVSQTVDEVVAYLEEAAQR